MTMLFILLLVAILIMLIVAVHKLYTMPTGSNDLVGRINSMADYQTRFSERLAERLAILNQTSVDLKHISSDIANFKDVLMGSKQARGAFGERQLTDLVTDILPPESYQFQTVINCNGTTVRPDCLIKLPYPPGDMVIDSKFPMESYAKYVSAANDAERAAAQKQFEIDVRAHIDAISSKYIIPGVTADSAIMFIPSESIFAYLHTNCPGTVEYGHKHHVFIVSPSTLWATLNTLRSVMSDIKIKKVANQIKTELGLLLSDMERLNARSGALTNHFRMATDDLNQLQTSATKITARAEKITALDFDYAESE